MDRYDKDTQKFIDDVSGEDLTHKALQQAKSLTSAAIKGTPPATYVAKQLIHKAVDKIYEDKVAYVNPISLYGILNDHYKRDWWDWEPETLWHSLKEDHSIEASDDIRNMVQALQVVVSTNAPFEHWHVFENVGHAFSRNTVHFDVVQPLELDEISRTLRVLSTIRPQQEFEPEIFGYIASCAKHSGVVFLPKELFGKASQEYLDKIGNDLVLKSDVERMWPAQHDSIEAVQVQLNKLHEVVNGIS